MLSCALYKFVCIHVVCRLSEWLCQTLMGTDIADLLLDGHEPESRAYTRMSTPASQVVEGSANTSVTEDRLSATSAVDANSAELTDRFRHLLLHGRKKVSLAVCDMSHPYLSAVISYLSVL